MSWCGYPYWSAGGYGYGGVNYYRCGRAVCGRAGCYGYSGLTGYGDCSNPYSNPYTTFYNPYTATYYHLGQATGQGSRRSMGARLRDCWPNIWTPRGGRTGMSSSSSSSSEEEETTGPPPTRRPTGTGPTPYRVGPNSTFTFAPTAQRSRRPRRQSDNPAPQAAQPEAPQPPRRGGRRRRPGAEVYTRPGDPEPYMMSGGLNSRP